MPQFKIAPGFELGQLITLPPEESHHIRNVFRLQRGAAIRLFDGTGRLFVGRIDEIGIKEVRVFLEKEIAAQQPAQKIILWQGLLKGEKMDWVVQKATELGVTELHPFTSSRCIVKITEKDKAGRWQKIANAAAKQCNRSHQMTVFTPKKYETILGEMPEGIKIFCWEAEHEATLREMAPLLTKTSVVNLLVGPEGGFSAEETQQAKGHGCQVVGLGPLILRSETASLVALAILQYEISSPPLKVRGGRGVL